MKLCIKNFRDSNKNSLFIRTVSIFVLFSFLFSEASFALAFSSPGSSGSPSAGGSSSAPSGPSSPITPPALPTPPASSGGSASSGPTGTVSSGPSGSGSPSSNSLCPGNPGCSSGTVGITGFAPSAGSDPSYITVQPVASIKSASGNTDLSTGSFNYEYPLSIPSGRNSLKPNISLSYNSQGLNKNSVVGFGWNLNVPFIERNNKKGTNLLYANGFEFFASSVSGELSEISGGNLYGAKTENGENLKYFFSRYSDLWEVRDKKGYVYIFGATSTSKITNPTDPSQTAKWMLENVIDNNGNSINFHYQQGIGYNYLSSINYVNDPGMSSGGIYSISFIYESRSDISTSYSYGFISKIDQRLKEINFLTNNSISRKINISYLESGIIKRSLISTITETGYGEDGSQIIFPETKFEYSSEDVMDMSTISSSGLPGNMDFNQGVVLADINGDSYVDVLQAYDDTLNINNSRRAVFLNSLGSGFVDYSSLWVIPNDVAFCQKTNLSSCASYGSVAIDVNGDGLNDLVTSNGQYSKVYINNGSGWTYDAGWDGEFLTLVPTAIYRPQLNDGNGDALLDRSSLNSLGIGMEFNEGVGMYAAQYSSQVPDFYGTRSVDLNGDGLFDVARANYDNGIFDNGIYINNGSDFVKDVSWAFPGDDTNHSNALEENKNVTTAFFADLNNDGLPDYINRDGLIYINNGSSDFIATTSLPFSPQLVTVQVGDFNSDGLIDVFKNSCSAGVCSTDVYKNKAKIPNNLLIKITRASGAISEIKYKSSASYIDAYNNLLNPKLPLTVLVVDSITDTETLTNISSTRSFSYEKGAFTFKDYLNKRFAGFEKVTETKPDNSKQVNYFHQGNETNNLNFEYADSFSKIGILYRSDVLSDNGSLMTRQTNKFESATSTSVIGDRFFVFKSQSIKEDYDGDLTHRDVAETYLYDLTNTNLLETINYGEVLASTPINFTDIKNDFIKTTNTYTTNSYDLFSVSRVQVVDSNGNTISDKKIYYDNNVFGVFNLPGLITREEEAVSGGNYANSYFTYDAFGNLKTKTDHLPYHITSYLYDSYNFLPIKITNPLGQFIQYEYDYSSGATTKIIDYNGGVFEKSYDAFDRPILEKIPNPLGGASLIKTEYIYIDTPLSISETVKDHIDSSLVIDSIKYLDSFGREIQLRVKTENDSMGLFAYKVVDSVYNKDGRLDKKSLPYFSSGLNKTSQNSNIQLFTSYLYDALNRVVSESNAIGSITSEFNDWGVKSKDLKNHIKNYIYDARGNLITVKEHNGRDVYITQYSYDSLNNLIKIKDAKGNVRNFEYDFLGNLMLSEDLHGLNDSTFSVLRFGYDINNNLIVKHLGDGNRIVYAYDYLNRQTSETLSYRIPGTVGYDENFFINGSSTAFYYDSCQKGVGRLCSVFADNYSKNIVYNILGDEVSVSEKILNSEETFSYDYNLDGSIKSITYPTGDLIEYELNQGGDLEKVSELAYGTTTKNYLIKDFDYSPLGLVSYSLKGNGTHECREYDELKLYRLSWQAVSLDSVTCAKTYAGSGNATTTTLLANKSDGFFYADNGGSWSSEHDKLNSDISSDYYSTIDFYSLLRTNNTAGIQRSMQSFDTSVIPDNANILSSKVKYFFVDYKQYTKDGYHYVNVYGGFPTDPKKYTNADYSKCGDEITNPTEYSNKAFYDTLTLPGYNDLVLNSEFSDAINKSGFTSLCLRDGHDAENVSPSANSKLYGLNTYSSENYPYIHPILEITYDLNTPTTTQLISSYDYLYDNNGNIISITESQNLGNIDGVSKELKTKTAYQYDGLNRLVKAKTSDFTTGSTTFKSIYEYDEIGNILSKKENQKIYKYIYGNKSSYANPHAVMGITDSSSSSSNNKKLFEYDKNGNITLDGLTGIKNTWDIKNELLISKTGSSTIFYLYNPSGIRTRMEDENEVSTFFSADFTTKKYKADESIRKTIYISGNGELLGKIENVQATATSSVVKIKADSKDSYILRKEIGSTWSSVHDNQDGTFLDDTYAESEAGVSSGPGLGSYRIFRSFMSFNTATSSRDKISKIELQVYPKYVANDSKDKYSYINLFPSYQASTTLQLSDYSKCGDKVSNPAKISDKVDINNISPQATTTFSVYKDNFNLVDRSGYTNLCLREGHDIENIDPGVILGTRIYDYLVHESANASNTPVLVITFSTSTSVSNLSYIYSDHLGSTKLILSDNSSNLSTLESSNYSPYGDIINSVLSGVPEPHKYTGHELDSSTQYTYAKARYLNTDIGRFISIDPVFWSIATKGFEDRYNLKLQDFLKDPQLQNSYSYARDNPINFNDPDGECVWDGCVAELSLAIIGLSNAISAFIASPIGQFYLTYQLPQAVDDIGSAKTTSQYIFAGLGAIPDFPGGGLADDVGKNILNRRDLLLNGVENKTLKNIIGNLYRNLKKDVEIIGDGGAIDAARYELETGKLVGGKSHLIKVDDSIRGIEKLKNSNQLSSKDLNKANFLLDYSRDIISKIRK